MLDINTEDIVRQMYGITDDKPLPEEVEKFFGEAKNIFDRLGGGIIQPQIAVCLAMIQKKMASVSVKQSAAPITTGAPKPPAGK